MKIVAGMGSIDDYIRLVNAGADEVFCGYVPHEWNEKYGTLFPLNRREVLYYNVQIGCLEDMKILRKMVDVYKVPVTVTFNYLYYLEEQYEYIEKIMRDLIEIGFDEFIIADPALILYLEEKDVRCSIHLSGECGEINRLSIDFFNQFKNITRYIFHRKNTIEDMDSCIKADKRHVISCEIDNSKTDNMESESSNKSNSSKAGNMQYEAFILNELCHYTGAFCSSLHCDELSHLCKIPYHMAKISEESDCFKKVDDKFKNYYEDQYDEDELEVNIEQTYDENQCISEKDDFEDAENEEEEDMYHLGSTGCGLCALKKLKEAGVTHLKVVGRGKYIDYMERDVKNLKRALKLLDDMKTEDMDYDKKLKNTLFNGNCSGECYYLK